MALEHSRIEQFSCIYFVPATRPFVSFGGIQTVSASHSMDQRHEPSPLRLRNILTSVRVNRDILASANHCPDVY